MLKSLLKRSFARYTNTGKKVTTQTKKIFMDKDLFKSQKYLDLYVFKGINSLRFTSLGLLLFGGYHFYNYNFGKYQEYDRFSNGLFGTLSAIGLLWMNYRSRRTLKKLSVWEDGSTFILKRFTWFGFREEEMIFGNHNLKGITHFLNRKLKMPMVVYQNDSGKKGELFFKTDGILYEDYFKTAAIGYSFNVVPKKMHKILSKKKIKNYM